MSIIALIAHAFNKCSFLNIGGRSWNRIFKKITVTLFVTTLVIRVATRLKMIGEFRSFIFVADDDDDDEEDDEESDDDDDDDYLERFFDDILGGGMPALH